ncbi:cytoplasmic sensor hybrid histidine kinase [Rhodobacteraceae bacterium HTCC2150]|nr:cytoplasmic sensor hybrid histidine kinase [Rhodobacteraceae bacterium HTCC2150]
MKKVWCRMKNPEIKSPVSPLLRLVDQLSQQDKERLISETVTDLPMGIAIFDAKGKLLHLNGEFAEILPSDGDFSEIRQSEFLASLLSCIDGSSTAVAERWFEKLLDQSNNAPIEVANCTLADGATYCFDFAETKFGGSCIFATDISALNRELIVANAARVRAESEIVAKGDYLAMMTHELRTPMNGVVGMANLLLESNLDSEQRLFAETILSSGNSLLGIINKILNSSKEHSLCSIVENEAFDLERSIHEVILLLQTKAADQGLELVVDYDMFLPTAFLGDKGRIRQILLNLIGNASKFTEQGHILVRVVGVPETEKAQNIHVTVEDTGMGIPKDQLGGVFDKYTQVESSQTDGIEGTGLGLAITKELVEHMGGKSGRIPKWAKVPVLDFPLK